MNLNASSQNYKIRDRTIFYAQTHYFHPTVRRALKLIQTLPRSWFDNMTTTNLVSCLISVIIGENAALIYGGSLLQMKNLWDSLALIATSRERAWWGYIFVYFQERSLYPNNLSATWNSYNKDTVAFCKCEICTCECPDLMKQLVFQGYGIFICTKCWLLVDFCLKI